jgi:hypothetical protein
LALDGDVAGGDAFEVFAVGEIGLEARVFGNSLYAAAEGDFSNFRVFAFEVFVVGDTSLFGDTSLYPDAEGDVPPLLGLEFEDFAVEEDGPS